MNVEKFLIILFVLITFLLSVGGVFAEEMVNESVTDTSFDDALSSQAVLTDESLYVNNPVKSSEDESIVANFTADVTEGIDSLEVSFTDTSIGSPSDYLWDFGDGSNSTEKNPKHTYNIGCFNVSLKASNNQSSDTLVKSGLINVYFSRDVIVNPDFDTSTKLWGWDYKDASVFTYGKYAKNGKRFLKLSGDGYASQVINLGTVDYIGFWYMSEFKGSSIEVLLDDISTLNYTIKTAGLGKWEYILLNTTNYTGFHNFKLLQKDNTGYVDCFNVVYNSDIDVNFTLTDYSLVGDNLTLSFNDCSYGLISDWLWDFGDGNTSNLQNVTHSYKAGYYTVTLTVFNKNTTKSMNYTIPISFPTIMRNGEEYPSVQSAIEDAIDGDVINIPNNIFYNEINETIIINKSIILNFNNCTVIANRFNPIINVIDGANVVVTNISLNNVILQTDKSSKLSVSSAMLNNLSLFGGNIILIDNNLSRGIINVDGANVNITNSDFINSSIIINSGEVFIFNNTFSFCDVAINQNDGKSDIKSNIITDNHIGVNVSGGISNISFNSIYNNDVGLVYNSTVVNVNNWWGTNNPVYICDVNLVDCDILQLGSIKSNLTSWLILNITESMQLDYDYWIAGVTYYNLTLDFTHNNLGENTVKLGNIKDLKLTLNNFDEYSYYLYHFQSSPFTEKKYIISVTSSDCNIVNGRGECIFSTGYLTNHWNKLNLTILNENYTVPIKSQSINQNFSYNYHSGASIVNITNNVSSTEINSNVVHHGELYNYTSNSMSNITPSCIFKDNLTVVINCNVSDAVIFYTLDGTNPGYSPTRHIYYGPFMVNESCTVHYSVINHYGDFVKDCIDYIIYYADSFIKQNVFVEMLDSDKNLYTLDGSNPKDLNTSIFYTHPFIVRNITQLNFARIDYYSGSEHNYHFADSRVRFYNFDFSVNYVKNSTNNYSNSIWNQYQGDIHNTGVTNMSGPVTNVTSWSNTAITSSGSALVDNNGRIIVGGEDGYLYYLNNQGLVIWRYGTTSKILCTPTIGSDGNIYFSNWWNSSVYCISTNGSLIWKYNLGDFNTGTSPVFGLDNKLYIITSNGFNSNIYVFKEGVLIGNFTIPLISASTPVVGQDGTLYMVGVNQELVVVNNDGSLRYSKSLLSSQYGVNVPYDHISISVDWEGNLYVLQGQYTDNKWYYFSDNVVRSYYANGTLRWFNRLSNYIVSGTPTYYGGALYITVNNIKDSASVNDKMLGGRLIAVNATNGALLWSKNITSSGSTLSSPLISGDEIIYVASNNSVYAFNISGDEIWEYTMTGKYGNPISFSSPTLAADGTLIVTTNQGIFAFNDWAADFNYEHVNGTASTIQFKDMSTKGSIRYYWMFGDGNVSMEQNPIHEYASDGKYRVVLLVEYNNNVTLARNTTIEVEYFDIVPPSNVTAYINDTLTVGGVFNETQWVSLNASDKSNFTIYYTVDGSNPINSSTSRVYSGPFDVEVDTVLSMVAIDSAGNIGNVTSIRFRILDALNVNRLVNSTLINKIQKLLDDAEEDSKFVFDYEVLYGANFTITKKLNLISNNNTKLISDSIQPVFTFTESAKGSIVNGFNITNFGGDGILVNDTSDITIRNCIVNATGHTGVNIIDSNHINVNDSFITDALNGIIVNRSSDVNINHAKILESYDNGVWIYQSRNTTISNSLLENNGKDQYTSKANHVLIDDSKDTGIYGNTINYGFFGIHLYHTTDGVIIENNTIYEGSGDAILLSNYYSNVNITHNLIDGSFNGIDFMGYSVNVTIVENTIENLHEHDDDIYAVFVATPFFLDMMNYIYEVNVRDSDDYFNHRNNGIQVSNPASNFDEGNTIIIDNAVIKLGHRAWEARKYGGYLNTGCDGYGYNLMDGSASYTGEGGATQYREGKVDLVVDRIGDATFRLRLINRLDGHYLSNIPSFDVTFRAGGFTQTVKFINDSAIATFDVASVVSDIEAIISTEIRKSASFTMEITEGYNSSNRESDSGYEEGEAINNPDPVIPSIDSLINGGNTNPVNPEIPEVEPSGIGNGTGDGIGNGTGSGNSTGNGTGTGTGNGNSTGIGNATGDNTSDNGTGDGNSDVTNPDDPGSTPGDNPQEPSVNPDSPDNPVDDNNSTVDTPETPENPVNETNNTVETPEIPEEPSENNTNNNVETPEEPVEDNNSTVETPEVPDEPVNETVNGTVDVPEVPDEPVNETNNNTVETPEIPEEPIEENNNNTSDNQDVPIDSGDEPETPANSDDESDVVENNDSVSPSDSGDVSEVIESSEQVTPSASGEVIESSEPVTPDSPQDPTPELEVSEVNEDSSSSTSKGESSASSDSSVGPQGGSTESGGAGKAYEVSKVIDLEKSSWQIVGAVVLFAIIIILGYGYRWGKKDGDDF